MSQFWLDFWNEEEGLEVVEILLILAVLIGVALLFQKQITQWAKQLFSSISGELGNF